MLFFFCRPPSLGFFAFMDAWRFSHSSKVSFVFAVSEAVGLAHPDVIKSLTDMRAAEARSAQIARPEGVARSFQIVRYKIEPVHRARNLLSKHDWRSALLDKPEPRRP